MCYEKKKIIYYGRKCFKNPSNKERRTTMTKFLIIKNPVCGIYQVDVDLYNSEEEARKESLVDEQDIYKIAKIEIDS